MPEIVVQTIETDLKYQLFGWKNIRFNGILSRPLFAYIILCICNFIQNFSVNGANNAVISTLERVFYLNSVQSGLFLALYDAATVFSSPIVGYLGSRYSSPIFFSLNMIIVGIGNMLIASSNFLQRDRSSYFNNELAQYLSKYNNVLFQCNKDLVNEKNFTDVICLTQERLSTTSQYAKFLLYFGNFVNGIGSVALFTIGITYIERIFPREKAAYCQGIYFAVGTIGGALGIVASGRFLLLHTKFISLRRIPAWLTPNHPLWIGCWWLPYIIYGALCLLIGLFVSGLPNYVKPGRKHPIVESASMHPNADGIQSQKMSVTQQESPTNISNLSLYSVKSDLSREPFEIHPDKKHLTVNPLNNEYHLSNRRFRQLNPLELKPKIDSSIVIADTEVGFINRAYSNDVLDSQISSANLRPSIPLPKTISDDVSIDSQQLNITHSGLSTSPSNSQIPPKTVLENLRHMWFVSCKLMKNTSYICVIIANLFEGILIKGFVPFITKYFEYQHQLDTSTATLVTGAIALISVIIACPIGAYFMNKFSWTPVKCARICGIIFTVSAFLFLFLTLSCPELKFEYSSCSKSNTPCCRNTYHPVCTITGYRYMYLSPCHYGCTNQTTMENSTNLYSSCNCARNSTVLLTEVACQFRRIPCVVIFTLTMTGATLVVFFTAFIQVPMLQILLYSVPLSYQSMALGLRQTIVRVLGQTTGPLLFGYVFDLSCLVWLTDCYNRRTCKVYNNHRMGISMALSGFSTRIISGIACIIVFYIWKTERPNQVIDLPNSTTIPTDNSEKQDENGTITPATN